MKVRNKFSLKYKYNEVFVDLLGMKIHSNAIVLNLTLK